MAQILTLQQIAEHQRRSNRRLEILHEAKSRLAKEVHDALVEAYDAGKDLDGVSFELVFKSLPKKSETRDDKKTTTKKGKK